MRIVAAMALTLWVGACAVRVSNPPALLIDRSACSRCGMLISERAYAAAIRMPDGHDDLFDDIGCLVATLQQRAMNDVEFWFNDARDGDWIRGSEPVFVTSPAIRTPMGGGIAAYRDRAAAEQAAAKLGGQVVTGVWKLVERDRSGR